MSSVLDSIFFNGFGIGASKKTSFHMAAFEQRGFTATYMCSRCASSWTFDIISSLIIREANFGNNQTMLS